MASATLDYKVDDGFAVYVNGQEAGRYNLPEGSTYDTYTGTYAGDFFTGSISINPALLQSGSNVIAVEVHNSSATSSDIVWDASLSYMPKGSGSDEKKTKASLSAPIPNTPFPKKASSPLRLSMKTSRLPTPPQQRATPLKLTK